MKVIGVQNVTSTFRTFLDFTCNGACKILPSGGRGMEELSSLFLSFIYFKSPVQCRAAKHLGHHNLTQM